MKILLKIILLIIMNFAFIMCLIKTNQYSFISYIFGIIECGLYMIVSETLD